MKPMQKLTIPNDRMERLHYVKRMFPQAKGDDLNGEWAGGRSNALYKLHSIDAVSYAESHDYLDGSVTHLSPYLRYGCLTLSEAFAVIKRKFGLAAESLLMQFSWRDYWHQVWFAKGNAIYSEIEPPKVALGYAPLTDAIKQGETGLPCMDAFIGDLLTTGYVHNHARMWLASYIVHYLKMDWREAADWFEAHLLDGDIASNHLSWQWLASTFSSQPYSFNKEDLVAYAGEKYCAGCTANCPFDVSYEVLNARLFAEPAAAEAKSHVIKELPVRSASTHRAVAIYVHDEMLSPTNSLLTKPFPKIFVFDPELYSNWPLNRLQFVMDCLSEMMNVEVWIGDTYEVLMQRGVGEVITQTTANLKFKEMLSPFLTKWQPADKLVDLEMSAQELQRFFRYWGKAGPVLMADS